MFIAPAHANRCPERVGVAVDIVPVTGVGNDGVFKRVDSQALCLGRGEWGSGVVGAREHIAAREVAYAAQ